MRVYITTLGCRLNQSESDRLAREFAAIGHEIVGDAQDAELAVVNTCAVTHKATRESRQVARRTHRLASGAPTVVTGCASEIERDYFAESAEIALVTGHAQKDQLIPLLIERGILPAPDATLSEAFPLPHARTRAFVKIQDGCGNRCAYCVSRLARGDERSRPVQAILREVNLLVAEGFQEVVLTGLHAASYGRDLGTSLSALVRTLLAQTSIARLRLSSLEPWGASDELLELWSDPRLCRHLHLPLQSGCDRTLRHMRRGYNTRQFAGRVESARHKVSGIAISTDVLVGFPGENDGDFVESLAFVTHMQFAQAHVFPFSPRTGTEASAMAGQVPECIKHTRAQAVRVETNAAARRFRQSLIGQDLNVLWEQRAASGWTGLTDNYVRVCCASDLDLHNKITRTRITALAADGLSGSSVQSEPATGE